MSNQTSDNNKRIVKNTLLLYFRMLFIMVVSLYTSRVILSALGVDDFGIHFCQPQTHFKVRCFVELNEINIKQLKRKTYI